MNISRILCVLTVLYGVNNYVNVSGTMPCNEAKKPKINFTEIFGTNFLFPAKLQCTDKKDSNSFLTVSRIDEKTIPNDFINKTKGSVIVTFPDNSKDFIPYKGVYVCEAINRYGSDRASLRISIKEELTLTLNSSINKIMRNEFGILYTRIRKNRRFELNCYVTGTPPPKVKFNILIQDYYKKIALPLKTIELKPMEANTPYKVEVLTARYYRLSQSHFSKVYHSSFSCDATLYGKTVTSEIKVIEVPDIYRVNIISQQQGLFNQIVFVDKPFEIGCEMLDNANKKVKVKSIEWIFWGHENRKIELNQLAKQVYLDGNLLLLYRINQTYGPVIRGHCVMYVNETYDTISDQFKLHIKERPKIVFIYGEVRTESSFNMIQFPYNHTYDAKNTTEYKCLALTGDNQKVTIKWYKCKDEDCRPLELGNTIIFFPEISTTSDIGTYRCYVTIEIANRIVTRDFAVLYLKRKAAPKILYTINMDPKVSASLKCDNRYSSPEGNLTWSFIPQGNIYARNIPRGVKVYTENRFSSLFIKNPMKPEFRGKYICTIVNEYGSGGQEFNV